jgi:hypothetical protein
MRSFFDLKNVFLIYICWRLMSVFKQMLFWSISRMIKEVVQLNVKQEGFKTIPGPFNQLSSDKAVTSAKFFVPIP